MQILLQNGLKIVKNLPGLRPGPADPRPGTGCARWGAAVRMYGCRLMRRLLVPDIESTVPLRAWRLLA